MTPDYQISSREGGDTTLHFILGGVAGGAHQKRRSHKPGGYLHHSLQIKLTLRDCFASPKLAVEASQQGVVYIKAHMTKQKAKDTAKATVQKLKHDYFITWALTIELVVSQIFGYWTEIAGVLGEYAPIAQVSLIIIRVSAIAYKFYRTNSIKAGGTQ